jgi:LuxR family transcriptional regulator, quorum-sensing system regulator BjaR1
VREFVPVRDAGDSGRWTSSHHWRMLHLRNDPGGMSVIRSALDLCETALSAGTPAAVSDAFHAAILPRGVSYMQVRRYRRPAGRLTSRGHWDAGGFVARYAPTDYIGSDAANYVCFENNPLIEPVATGVTRFRFSDYAPRGDRAFGRYWDAYSQFDIGEAVAAVAYGRDRQTASLHIGFRDTGTDDDVLDSIHAAASLVAEKLMAFARGGDDDVPVLSQRERDAIGFVADGKTDWEIGTIMGVSEATARFHVDNARKKLGATNRAHAVARFVATHGLF